MLTSRLSMVQQTPKQKLQYGRKGTGHTIDYGIKPKKLDFVCEHCEKRYTYEFQVITRNEWNKELSEIRCPHCKKKRI